MRCSSPESSLGKIRCAPVGSGSGRQRRAMADGKACHGTLPANGAEGGSDQGRPGRGRPRSSLDRPRRPEKEARGG